MTSPTNPYLLARNNRIAENLAKAASLGVYLPVPVVAANNNNSEVAVKKKKKRAEPSLIIKQDRTYLRRGCNAKSIDYRDLSTSPRKKDPTRKTSGAERLQEIMNPPDPKQLWLTAMKCDFPTHLEK